MAPCTPLASITHEPLHSSHRRRPRGDARGDRRRVDGGAVRRHPGKAAVARPLELPDGRSETEVFDQLAALAARNADADSETCFIGAGMYDHYVPALVDAIVSRSEFLTPYTPYQPEVSQGGLQVMFEFQTAISELTALPAANASLYEGPSSVASALPALGAASASDRGSSPRGPAPTRRSRRTRGASAPRSWRSDCATGSRTRASSRTTSTPTCCPGPEPRTSSAPWRTWTRSPRPCTSRVRSRRLRRPDHPRVLRPPGECGVDIAVGEPVAGQSARLRRSVVRLLRRDRGAPAPDARADRRRDHRRRRPARLRPRPADPRAAHPAREGDPQHLHLAGPERARRHHLSGLARARGHRRARRAAVRRTAYAASGLSPRTGSNSARGAGGAEFAVRLDAPVAEVVDRVSEAGIAGYPLGREYPEYEDVLLVAITERRGAAATTSTGSRMPAQAIPAATPAVVSIARRPGRRRPRDDARIDPRRPTPIPTPPPAATRGRGHDARTLGGEAGARPFSLPPTGPASTRPRSPS